MSRASPLPARRIEEGERDVVERAGPRQQVEGLEHEADLLVAVERERSELEPPSSRPSILSEPRGRRVERADQVHEGRLAGARRAGHGEIFAARDLDTDALQRADDAAAEAVGLDQIAGDDLRGSGRDAAALRVMASTSRTRTTTSAPSGRARRSPR